MHTRTHECAKRCVAPTEECSEGKHTLGVWWTHYSGRRRIICSFICSIPPDVCSSAVAALILAAEQRDGWARPQVRSRMQPVARVTIFISKQQGRTALLASNGESHTANTRPSDGLTDIWSLKHRWVAHRDPSHRGKPVEAGQVDHIDMAARPHLNRFTTGSTMTRSTITGFTLQVHPWLVPQKLGWVQSGDLFYWGNIPWFHK